MRVKVLFFGVLRDWFGYSDELEFPDGATVDELLELLRRRTSKPSMDSQSEAGSNEQLWRSLAVAVKREYSAHGEMLREGDEVALLPPVSGGSVMERERMR